MKTLLKSASLIATALLFFSCNSSTKIELFNGTDLENWTIYVSTDDVAPEELFWVEDGIINTLGKPHGYIRTKETYSNYKLHVEWRWTETPTNSGVLLHVQGEDMTWPLSVECQLMNEHAGDLILIGVGAGITIQDSTYLVDSEENRFQSIDRQKESSEHPAGEWNSYDITSLDGSLEVQVNGVLQNSGTGMTLTEGNILLQSEGSPLQFRNITLLPL